MSDPNPMTPDPRHAALQEAVEACEKVALECDGNYAHIARLGCLAARNAIRALQSAPAPESAGVVGRTLEQHDVVEALLQCFIEKDAEGPAGVACAFHDAFGHRHSVVLKRKWLRDHATPQPPDNARPVFCAPLRWEGNFLRIGKLPGIFGQVWPYGGEWVVRLIDECRTSYPTRAEAIAAAEREVMALAGDARQVEGGR